MHITLTKHRYLSRPPDASERRVVHFPAYRLASCGRRRQRSPSQAAPFRHPTGPIGQRSDNPSPNVLRLWSFPRWNHLCSPTSTFLILFRSISPIGSQGALFLLAGNPAPYEALKLDGWVQYCQLAAADSAFDEREVSDGFSEVDDRTSPIPLCVIHS